MADAHPSRRTLEKFLDGQLPRDERERVVGHLLTRCPDCTSVTDRAWEEIRQGLGAVSKDPETTRNNGSRLKDLQYREALNKATAGARLEARTVERNSAEAGSLYHELLEHPASRRLTLVRNSRRFQTPELCHVLIERGFEQRFDDIQLGVELTELAIAVAEQADEESYGCADSHDLLGRAWAYHGNALRVASQLRRADEAFAQARRCFARGRGNELDKALLHRFTALLYRARRDFREARARQEQAIRLYLRQGETRFAAHVMGDMALSMAYSGEAEAAVPRLENALDLFVELGEDRDAAMVRHNLAFCLAETGELEKALQRVIEVRSDLQRNGDRLSLVRARWLEGRILRDLGHDWRAEEALLEARDAFVDESIGYDAALVCLDLAALYGRQLRVSEMRQLAESMLPIFQSRDVHREAIAALIIFREAALAETATVALIEKVGRYLHDARDDPRLKFESSR